MDYMSFLGVFKWKDMEYNGHSFAKRFDPPSYLYIIKAMNIFDATRNYDSLEDSLKHIKARLTLIAFKGDYLFMPEEMEMIKKPWTIWGKVIVLIMCVLRGDYGHDAFLVEYEKFDGYIKKALEAKV